MHGASAALPMSLAERVGVPTPHYPTTLGAMGATARDHAITGPAVIMLGLAPHHRQVLDSPETATAEVIS